MRKINLFTMLFFTIGVYSQTGINTISPTKTLDVNGETKVNTLNEIPFSDLSTARVAVANNDGTLGQSSLKSLLSKEGLLKNSHMTWPAMKIGKAAVIRMTGRIACQGSDFISLFFYNSQSGNFNVLATNRTITQVSPHVMRVESGCGSYIITFSPAAVGNGYYDITSSTQWIQGTISTTPYPY